MNERAIPRPGERYRHFKNKLYQIVAIAVHSETGEKMVVYQALYGDFGVWVRPLAMFLEPVDREKYPDAVQKYRFERVGVSGETEAVGGPAAFDKGAPSAPSGGGSIPAGPAVFGFSSPNREQRPNPQLLEFLDCETTEERLSILQKMKGKVGQNEIDSLCLCLDIRPSGGSLEEQLDNIRQCLKMQQRYDAPRLRRS